MSMEHKIRELRRLLDNRPKKPVESLPREPDGHKMNMSERYLMSVLKRVDPDNWEYTGDGTISIGRMKPDYRCLNGRKAVIELFGNAWHTVREADERVQRYKDLGYACLVIWGEQLEDDEDDLIGHILGWKNYHPRKGTGKNVPEPASVAELKDRIPTW